MRTNEETRKGEGEGASKGASKGTSMRPTAVRARKSLFDALSHRAPLREAIAAKDENFSENSSSNSLWLLDAFAGCGALGLEALSRWEGRGVFVENNPTAVASLRSNIERSALNAYLLYVDALNPPPATKDEEGKVRLAFFDPPYAQEEASSATSSSNWAAPQAFARQGWFAEGALIVFQVAANNKSSQKSSFALGAAFVPLGMLSCSSACFFFFRYAPTQPSARA